MRFARIPQSYSVTALDLQNDLVVMEMQACTLPWSLSRHLGHLVKWLFPALGSDEMPPLTRTRVPVTKELPDVAPSSNCLSDRHGLAGLALADKSPTYHGSVLCHLVVDVPAKCGRCLLCPLILGFITEFVSATITFHGPKPSSIPCAIETMLPSSAAYPSQVM